MDTNRTSWAGTILGLGALALAACSSGQTNPLPNIGCATCGPSQNNGQPPGPNPGPGPGPGPGPQDSGTTMTGGGDATTMTQSQTWTNGQQIASSVIIAAGATITIAPGATVTIGSGATITVNGTLTASSGVAATHATLTGMAWGGIVVAAGGTLSLDGVDITNASTAIHTEANDTSATYNNGIITAATTPFQLDTGSKLSTAHGTVKGTLGPTQVNGALTASHLDYDSNGHAGIVTSDATAVLSIDDSTLHGIGPVADMVVSSSGAASVHVAYTEIQQTHCAFHFDAITKFDISYVNVHDNAWAAMLYGSDRAGGPYTIINSNFVNNSTFGLDEQGANGPISVDGCYFSGNGTDQNLTTPPTNPAAAPIAAAAPRAN
jgi:hypothetical protein